MSARHLFALVVAVCTASQLGCCCMMNARCGGCGMGGQVFDCCGDSCASCGCPEASCCCPEPACCCPEPGCCCPEASCCCPEASCCCPDDCCGGGCCDQVGCGSGVRQRCPLLWRLRQALNRCYCNGCGGKPYCGEWSDCPPCNCDPCDCYGNYIGGPYGSQHGRRAQMARRNMNIGEELNFGNAQGETIYR